MRERIQNIRYHDESLEKKCIDADLPLVKLAILVGLEGLLVLFNFYTNITLPILVAFVLSVGSLLITPVKRSPFTPQAISD